MEVFDYNSYDYVVSFDFGTTYSGCSFIHTGETNIEQLRKENHDHIYKNLSSVKEWNVTNVEEKAPTIVIYSKNQRLLDWGYTAYDTWRSIDPETRSTSDNQNMILRKFKIKLTDTFTYKDDTQPDSLNVTATIDYLRKMKETLYRSINAESLNANSVNVDTEKIRYIFTVPAQWNEDERSAMRIMAINAGIIKVNDHENRLIIIEESLAATLFCERRINSVNCEYKFENGSRYMICDAGGGTVDLATYEATNASFNNQDDSTLVGRCQLTVGSGGHCGSVFVDDNMENLLLDILFHGAEEDRKQELKKIISPLMVDFIDDLKIIFSEECEEGEDKDIENATTFCLDNFYPEGQETIKTYEEGEKPEFIIEDEELHIFRQTMCTRVFDPQVEEVLTLIDNQIIKSNCAMIDALFLIGGFGESKYLQRRVKEKFGNRVKEVITNTAGNLAAMKGAVYFGLEELKKTQEINVIPSNFRTSDFRKDFALLICIDIGYEYSTCCYFDLDENREKYLQRQLIDVTGEYAGTSHKIPTVLEYSKENPDQVLQWGAEVNPRSNSRVVPNYMMSTCKDDFKKFITDYLKYLYEYAVDYIGDKRGKGTGKNKIRNCITMENCFNFFQTKKEMLDIAIRVGFFDNVSRRMFHKQLLLLNREDASAMYYKHTYYTADMYFWRIDISSKNKCVISRRVVRNADMASFTPTLENFDNTDICQKIEESSVEVDCQFNDTKIARLYNHNEYSTDDEGKTIKLAFGKEDEEVDSVISRLIEKIPKDKHRSNVTSRNAHIDNIYITGKFVLNRSSNFIEVLILDYLMKKLKKFVVESKNIVHVVKKQQSVEDSDNPESPTKYLNQFLQINVQRDCFHLILHKNTKLDDEHKVKHHNVRKLKSTTFEFDVVGEMVKRLRQYTPKKLKNCGCDPSKAHRMDTKIYDNALRYGLIHFTKNTLKFDENIEAELIYIDRCFTIEITPHTFLDKILKPTIEELVETMNMSLIQAGITQNYYFDHVFVSGNLLEASENVNEEVKKLFVRYLFRSLFRNIADEKRIKFSKCDNNEVIYGAAMYSLDPELYTERVSRRTYAVSLQAHPVLTDELPLILANTENHVDLHFQLKKGSPETIKVDSETKIRLINQNDKVTMDLQSVGTFERFFADEECLVYATIYAKEEKDNRYIGARIDQNNDTGFQKIHQFEIHLKRKDVRDLKKNKNKTNVQPRLSFDIRLSFLDKNEVIFDANVGQFDEGSIPSFKFRDEILVANIYGEHVK